MREIEFRGKEGDGVWVYGDLATSVSAGRAAILEIEVDPETVGQYTGLKDKNGKKIFEGDIVEVRDKDEKKYLDYVSYYAGYFLLPSIGYPVGRFGQYGRNVIGNIHDNPELLNREGGAE